MKLIKLSNFQLIATMLLIALIGTGALVLGQGKGHGGDKGKGKSKAERSEKGNKPQKAEKAERGNYRQEIKAQRQDRGNGRADRSKKQERERPQIIPSIREQRQRRAASSSQNFPKYNDRTRNERIEKPRQKKDKSRKNEKADRKYNKYETGRNQRPQYREDPRIIRDGRFGHGDPRLTERRDRRNARPYNYGYERSNEAHRRNAERKAMKNERKEMKKWAKRSNDYYDYDSYDYRRNLDRRERTDSLRNAFLRSVVVNVIGIDPRNSYSPQYDNYNYGAAYSTDYDRGYYDPYPTYQRNSTPYYGEQPYSYGANYGDEVSYGNSYVDDFGLPFLTDSSVGGFITSIFSKLIALGYNQGYLDAQNARSTGYNDANYNDPYDPYVYVDNNYQDIGYDPYSSLAENQLYLSEGYELGYRDAQYERNQFDPYNNGGGVDLVSLLLGNVL